METIPAGRRIRLQPRQAARHAGNKREQATVGSAEHGADGFLRHRFLPLYQEGNNVPDKATTEKDFFKSLSILSAVRGITPMDVSGQPYPYNIIVAHWDAVRQLNRTSQVVGLAIVKDPQGEVKLSTKEVYDTDNTLYYIPVAPLAGLLKDKQRRREGELLLSVFAYLFRIVRVPYYRDEYTDMWYHYEMMKEWITECCYEWTEAELNSSISQMNEAEYYGEMILRKIFNVRQLDDFKRRIDGFNPKDKLQRDCLKVACAAYGLWQQYPDRTLFDHMQSSEGDRDEEEDTDMIRADQYVSFVARTEGWLYRGIAEAVNNIFNECGEMKEPAIEQVYDMDAEQGTDDLGFEQRLFPLIKNLCELLNDLP